MVVLRSLSLRYRKEEVVVEEEMKRWSLSLTVVEEELSSLVGGDDGYWRMTKG